MENVSKQQSFSFDIVDDLYKKVYYNLNQDNKQKELMKPIDFDWDDFYAKPIELNPMEKE